MNSDDIVQGCVVEVLAGRTTPADSAAAFPNVPALQASLAAAAELPAARALTLRPEARQRIEASLLERARALRPATQLAAGAGRRAPAGWRWATASALVATVLAAGAGTAAASSKSVPGELLYGVKRADEGLQVFLSPGSARAFVHAELAQIRLDEMVVLSQRGSLEAGLLTNLAHDLISETTAALALVSETPAARQPEILNTLVRITRDEQTVLSAVKALAPAEAQAGLDQALQASSQGHDQALERLAETGAAQKPTSSPTSGNPTAIGTATATLPAATQTEPAATDTQTPPEVTHMPPGQTKVPPGQTHVPPGQTQVPPGQTKVPPGQTHVPPGQSQIPPGQTQVPPGQTKVPPGQTKIPPGQTHVPPGQTHAPPEKTHGPPGQDENPGRPTARPNGPGH